LKPGPLFVRQKNSRASKKLLGAELTIKEN